MTPKRLVVVGMGARADIYARETLKDPQKMQIVGVADPDPARVRMAQERYHIPPENCFDSVEALCARPRFADAAINGTMDRLHVRTTVPLLKRGYDVLLEKPFALDQREANALLACARRTGRRVMVCHVLRYAPFYRAIKQTLLDGTLGRIVHAEMGEQVSYFHESVSYVRGKYASPQLCGSGMLLSKCSHDLDILAWLMAQARPAQVSSVGSVFQFRPEMAPEGAGTHCLKRCAIERECPYSARRLYLEHPQRWANNIWHDSGLPEDAPLAQKEALLLRDDCPYSRCVYRCDLQVVDHQSLLIGFADGATGVFSMNGGASESCRHLRLTGTRGELYGRFEDERFTVSLIQPDAPGGWTLTEVDVSPMQQGNAHGQGDSLIMEDFYAMLCDKETSICHTSLADSMAGHALAFAAERSRLHGGSKVRL